MAPLPRAGKTAGEHRPRDPRRLSWTDRQPVLFEEKVKKRWKGRTPTNKLVFVETEENLLGQVLPVQHQLDRTLVDAGRYCVVGMIS